MSHYSELMSLVLWHLHCCCIYWILHHDILNTHSFWKPLSHKMLVLHRTLSLCVCLPKPRPWGEKVNKDQWLRQQLAYYVASTPGSNTMLIVILLWFDTPKKLKIRIIYISVSDPGVMFPLQTFVIN